MGCAMGIRLLAGAKIFASLKLSRVSLGPSQPPIQWVSVFFFSGVKQQIHEDDLSPPCNAKVKNEWMCKSTPHGTDKDNFAFSILRYGLGCSTF